jgi:hypothetical protein
MADENMNNVQEQGDLPPPPQANPPPRPIPQRSVEFLRALDRIGFTAGQSEEIFITQGISDLNELGILSASDITDIGKAIVTARGNVVPITKLKKIENNHILVQKTDKNGT